MPVDQPFLAVLILPEEEVAASGRGEFASNLVARDNASRAVGSLAVLEEMRIGLDLGSVDCLGVERAGRLEKKRENSHFSEIIDE
jgi:hypothetical protein